MVGLSRAARRHRWGGRSRLPSPDVRGAGGLEVGRLLLSSLGRCLPGLTGLNLLVQIRLGDLAYCLPQGLRRLSAPRMSRSHDFLRYLAGRMPSLEHVEAFSFEGDLDLRENQGLPGRAEAWLAVDSEPCAWKSLSEAAPPASLRCHQQLQPLAGWPEVGDHRQRVARAAL